MGSERAEQGNSLEDPSVVGACADASCIGRPADAADFLGELELTVASSLPFRGVGARADRWHATTAGGFSMVRSTTCLQVRWPWSARTRRSSMTATSKPFRFPPTSTPTHTATRQSMPQLRAVRTWLFGSGRADSVLGVAATARWLRDLAARHPPSPVSAANYGPRRQPCREERPCLQIRTYWCPVGKGSGDRSRHCSADRQSSVVLKGAVECRK